MDYFSISFHVLFWLDYFPHISLICFSDAWGHKIIRMTKKILLQSQTLFKKKRRLEIIKKYVFLKKIDYFQTSMFFFQLFEINPPTPHFCSHRLCLIFSSKLQHWQSVNCKNLQNNSTQLIMKHWNNSCRCIRGS